MGEVAGGPCARARASSPRAENDSSDSAWLRSASVWRRSAIISRIDGAGAVAGHGTTRVLVSRTSSS